MIWLQNFYVPETACRDDPASLKQHCCTAKTKGGKDVYVHRESFKNPSIREAFQNLKNYTLNEFRVKILTPDEKQQALLISQKRREENQKNLPPGDILNYISDFLDPCTKIAYALTCHKIKNNVKSMEFKKICMFAALYGYTNILKWARESGAPWDEMTCAWAAGAGHLETLKWARANGALWNWRTPCLAEYYGYHDVAKWAHDNGAPQTPYEGNR